MPYPFTQMPTLGEFIARVTSDEYKAKIKKIKTTLIGPRGNANIEFLIRTGKDGKAKIAIIPCIREDEHLNPSILRSLCNQLDISPVDFGLILN
jgi:hypothetical protein